MKERDGLCGGVIRVVVCQGDVAVCLSEAERESSNMGVFVCA